MDRMHRFRWPVHVLQVHSQTIVLFEKRHHSAQILFHAQTGKLHTKGTADNSQKQKLPRCGLLVCGNKMAGEEIAERYTYPLIYVQEVLLPKILSCRNIS